MDYSLTGEVDQQYTNLIDAIVFTTISLTLNCFSQTLKGHYFESSRGTWPLH